MPNTEMLDDVVSVTKSMLSNDSRQRNSDKSEEIIDTTAKKPSRTNHPNADWAAFEFTKRKTHHYNDQFNFNADANVLDEVIRSHEVSEEFNRRIEENNNEVRFEFVPTKNNLPSQTHHMHDLVDPYDPDQDPFLVREDDLANEVNVRFDKQCNANRLSTLSHFAVMECKNKLAKVYALE